MEIITTPLLEIKHAELSRMLQALNRDARTLLALENVPHFSEHFAVQGRIFFERFVALTNDPSIRGVNWAGYQFSAEGATALAKVHGSDESEGKIITIIPEIPHADESESEAAAV